MIRAFVFFAAVCTSLLLAAAQTVAQNPEQHQQRMSADEAAIRQIPEDWIRFYNTGDAAKVAALYTEDGYYLSAHILAARESRRSRPIGNAASRRAGT